MVKFKLPIGYTVYRVTAEECLSWGGLGVCDECNVCGPYGYLVPVLNHYMCPSCYHDWVLSCKFYAKDLDFERFYISYYEKILPVVYSPVPV